MKEEAYNPIGFKYNDSAMTGNANHLSPSSPLSTKRGAEDEAAKTEKKIAKLEAEIKEHWGHILSDKPDSPLYKQHKRAYDEKKAKIEDLKEQKENYNE